MRTLESDAREMWNNSCSRALVNELSIDEKDQPIELHEDLRGRLMDRADNRFIPVFSISLKHIDDVISCERI